MLKIAVFGFYTPDQGYAPFSPVSTNDFMRIVWALEPPESRMDPMPNAPAFVKLTQITKQPVYVQALSDRMAPGVGNLNYEGYIAIIDAVKILAPRTIQNALRRLAGLHPDAHLMIAAARQNESDALSSSDIREVLGLHCLLPIYPFAADDPHTVERMLRRLVRYIESPVHCPPPVFADGLPRTAAETSPDTAALEPDTAAPPKPRIHGLDHVAITVRDLARALDFYRGILGFRLLGHLDFPNDARGFTLAYLDTGRGVLELFSFNDAETQPAGWSPDDIQAGLRHFALRVTGLDAIAEGLMAAGVPFTVRPMDANGGVRIAFFTDPDGTLIELIEGDLVYSRR
jgi:catechol 2,3-dioxygenase-like lactoylglutathione lyase family enzyme